MLTDGVSSKQLQLDPIPLPSKAHIGAQVFSEVCFLIGTATLCKWYFDPKNSLTNDNYTVSHSLLKNNSQLIPLAVATLAFTTGIYMRIYAHTLQERNIRHITNS